MWIKSKLDLFLFEWVAREVLKKATADVPDDVTTKVNSKPEHESLTEQKALKGQVPGDVMRQPNDFLMKEKWTFNFV